MSKNIQNNLHRSVIGDMVHLKQQIPELWFIMCTTLWVGYIIVRSGIHECIPQETMI